MAGACACSIVIPTYGREQVLCDTIRLLLDLEHPADEIVVVDQSPWHEPQTTDRLTAWQKQGCIRWIRLERPSITGSMNRGVLESTGKVVLFLDDDILPDRHLVRRHLDVHERHPEAWAVAGQVLQPGQEPYAGDAPSERRGLRADLAFPFNASRERWVANAMAGNLSVRRERILGCGGFDENFGPPVAYRFETEFVKRLVAAGGRIMFEPSASLRHLRAPSGGTRSLGSHLNSASPIHGAGDYYYALRCGRGWDRVAYMARRPFREVCTRFHLRHPWWIPVKFIGELRALVLAIRLHCGGPRLLPNPSSPQVA